VSGKLALNRNIGKRKENEIINIRRAIGSDAVGEKDAANSRFLCNKCFRMEE
jgi:hypothetical protein